MTWIRRHPWLSVLAGTAIVAVLFVAGFGLSLASEARRLPWQAEPTRIPITPFADIPGFGAPTPTPAPVPTTPTPLPSPTDVELAGAAARRV